MDLSIVFRVPLNILMSKKLFLLIQAEPNERKNVCLWFVTMHSIRYKVYNDIVSI